MAEVVATKKIVAIEVWLKSKSISRASVDFFRTHSDGGSSLRSYGLNDARLARFARIGGFFLHGVTTPRLRLNTGRSYVEAPDRVISEAE